MSYKKKYKRTTPYSQISFEDRVNLAGGGRIGYETRKKHNLPSRW